MRSMGDSERGVTAQIGAVLLLGVLMLLLTMYQASIVPAQNQNVEFTHNERVQSDLLDARNAIIRAATSGSTQPVSVELGTTFPSRVVAINPAPAGGTVGPSSVAGNATVTGAEPLDRSARAYWANESHNMSYRTTGFRYQPSYREYTTAPTTIFENTVLYNEFPDGPSRTVSGQSIIDGRTISLVSLQGMPTRSTSGTAGLEFRAVSPSSTRIQTIAVGNQTGEQVNITLPTQLSETNWSTLLAEEPYVDQPNVTVTDGNVTIPLVTERDGSAVTYNLRTAAVTASRPVPTPEPAYITLVDGANQSVPENTTNTLVGEVRDRYNNPVSGAEVSTNFTTPSIQLLSASELSTTGTGRARFTYRSTAPISTASASVEMAGYERQATTELSTFATSDKTLKLPSNLTRTSTRSGQVRISYTASGTGEFSASLRSTAETLLTAPLRVYSIGSGLGDGPIRIEPDGTITVVEHTDVNGEDYSDNTLVIPEGEDFVEENNPDGDDQSDSVDYLFKDYQIDGNVRTDQSLSMEATDGAINIGSTGSVISGKQLTLTANGPNGSINVDGATFDTSPGNVGGGNGRIDMDTSGNISAVGAEMTANKTIELRADGSIDLTGATLELTEGQDVIIDAGGSIDLTGATITIPGGTITLIAGDDIRLDDATLDIGRTRGSDSATADATAIYVQDARFLGGADPLEILSGTVYGSPAPGGDTDPPQNP